MRSARELGGVLRGHREGQGRSLGEIASEAGCSPAYLSEVERGLKDVSADLLVAITYALVGSRSRRCTPTSDAGSQHGPRQSPRGRRIRDVSSARSRPGWMPPRCAPWRSSALFSP